MDDDDPLAGRAQELRQRVEAHRIWLDVLHQQRLEVARDAQETARMVRGFLDRLPPLR